MVKLKIAQIGTEHDHAPFIMDTLLKHPDLFEVVGFSIDEDSDAHYQKTKHIYSGIPLLTKNEILNYPDLDAVTIESSEHNLVNYATEAAVHGLHIHMDKPGSFDFDSFQNLINIVKTNHLILRLGYMYRFNPAIKKAASLIKEGTIGEIINIEAQMNCFHTIQKRQWLKTLPGGMMFFLGCHLIDLILSFQGLPISFANFNACTNLNQVTSEDFGLVLLKYPHGISYAKTSACEVGGFSRRQIVICGTKATIEIYPLEEYVEENNGTLIQSFLKLTLADDELKHGWGRVPQHMINFAPFDRYESMMKHFFYSCTNPVDNPSNYDYELDLYHYLHAICSQTRRPFYE